MKASTAVPEVAGLRKFRLFESTNVEAAREHIGRALQPHSLRPLSAAGCTGASKSRMDFFSFAGIGIGSIAYAEAMSVDVPSVAGYHLLMFCRQGGAEARVDGQLVAVGGPLGIVCAPQRPFSAQFSAGSEQLVVRIGREAMRAHTGMDEVVFHNRIDVRSAAMQAWLWQMRALTRSASLADSARRHPKVAATLEGLLIHLLMDGQPWRDLGEAPGSATPACVRRAEAFIHEHAHEAIHLQQIAAAADVPVRTLLDGFKRFRQSSPIRYLKDVRLDQARARLLGGGVANITALALDCGFAHVGRFARAYAERFGEAPSQTLARMRR